MKLKKNAKIAIIAVASLVGVALLYALICCGITFIPMIRMAKVNETACGVAGEPAETIDIGEGATLYAFPEGNVRDKYVVICPGGGYTDCALETEGYAVAAEFNRLGYAAFVLRYRTGRAITTPKAPLDDLAAAIRYVDDHARQYDVYAGHYILCGFSAGGNLIGLFGTQAWGYARYEGIKAPEALLMGYPWCNPTAPTFNGNVTDYAFYASLNGGGARAFLGSDDCYDEMDVPLWIDDAYPRTYIMHGANDVIAPVAEHSDVLVAALKEKGTDYRYRLCEDAPHGCGIGLGTDAAGWIGEAMDYAYENWYDEVYEADPLTPSELTAKAGGFMCGVCHPNERYEAMTELGSDWARFDITCLPLDEQNQETEGYRQFKARAQEYVDHGFKVFAVTPFPNTFIAAGLDPRDAANLRRIKEQLRYIATDLQGLVSAFQVMNEQTEAIFRTPLTMEESAAFMATSLQVMSRFRGHALVGYNLSANDFYTYVDYMQGYHDYADYIGVDVYLGCFETMTHSLGFLPAASWLWYVWTATERPVLLTEFGYISAGAPKTEEEKLAILRRYGAEGDTVAEAETYARAHINEFVDNENFPASLRNLLRSISHSDEELGNRLFGGSGVTIDYRAHLYMELGENVNLEGYPHTPEGQAAHFEDFFDAVVYGSEYLCGAIMYCLNDAEACGYCGQADCPVETKWGLLTVDGEKKPAFYAVKEGFAKCKLLER